MKKRHRIIFEVYPEAHARYIAAAAKAEQTLSAWIRAQLAIGVVQSTAQEKSRKALQRLQREKKRGNLTMRGL